MRYAPNQPAEFIQDKRDHFIVHIPPRAGGPGSKSFSKRNDVQKALLSALIFRDMVFLSENQPIKEISRGQRSKRALPVGISVSMGRITKARPKPQVAFYRAYWSDDGEQITRYFSVAQYGSPEAALQAAVMERAREIAEIQNRNTAREFGLNTAANM